MAAAEGIDAVLKLPRHSSGGSMSWRNAHEGLRDRGLEGRGSLSHHYMTKIAHPGYIDNRQHLFTPYCL